MKDDDEEDIYDAVARHRRDENLWPYTMPYPKGPFLMPLALSVPPRPDMSLTDEQLWGEKRKMDVIDFSKMDRMDRVLFINMLRDEFHESAKAKGFHDEPADFPRMIALMHSELSEALEAHRCSEPVNNIEKELADVIIRVLDCCGAMNYNIGSAIFDKMEYNQTRPNKHGKRY